MEFAKKRTVMDFTKLLELLGDNKEAAEFVQKVSKDLEQQKANIAKLAEEADSNKTLASEAEKYKTEAKRAFEERDRIKEQLASAKKGDDKDLLETIEKLKTESTTLKSQILQKEQNEILGDALAGMEFKGEGEVKERLKNIIKGELSKGLIKHEELGWIYADETGKPKRNPEDPTNFLNPKTIIQTKEIKGLLETLSGVSAKGDNYNGGEKGGGESYGSAGKLPSFKELQKAAFKNL